MNGFFPRQKSTWSAMRMVKVCCCLLALLFCGFVTIAAAQNQAPAQAQDAPPPVVNPLQPTPQAPAPIAESPPQAVGLEPGTPPPLDQPGSQSVPTAAVLPPGVAPVEPVVKSPSADYAPIVQQTLAALTKAEFTYVPNKVIDPFKPFISPVVVAAPGARLGESEDDESTGEMQKPLTPLQKMTLAEVEKGLRAITWSDYGRKAIIEDAAGKGYIVSIGTPVSDKNGVISQIFNDRLVVQQETWDREAKRMVAQDTVVKLRKRDDK
jgi:hypothetical protein